MAEFDCLITGGAGFVGSELALHLLKQGRSVVSIDTITDPSRLDGVDGPLVRVVGDVRDAEAMDYWIGRCERVFHLAAVVGVDEYIQRPLDVLDVNILGTRNVLASCLARGRSVLVTSTSEVYGKNDRPLHESSDRIYGEAANHRWSYAVSKSAAEHYAHAMADQGLCFVAVRLFNVYGPTMDAPGKGRVISKFIGAIQEGRPLVLVEGGKAVRSFCYIDDAVEAIARLGTGLHPGASYRGLAVNIGRHDPVDMAELAALMIELSGHQAGVVNVAGDDFFGKGFEEIPYRVPITDRLTVAVGLAPSTTLRKGVGQVLQHWGLLARPGAVQADRPPTPIPFARPRIDPDATLMRTIEGSLRSGQVTNSGPLSRELEQAAAAALGLPDVVTVTNGYDALDLAIKAMASRGRAVLPSYTFVATLNSLLNNGLQPLFCDVDPETYTLSPGHLDALLRAHPDISCVVPVNVFGVPPDLVSIAALAAEHGARVLYDNAHGFGTEVDGNHSLPAGVVQTFSMHATKVLPAVEAGLVACDTPDFLELLRRLRNHGIGPEGAPLLAGTNAKLDELRAAVGLHMLRGLPEALSRRRSYAEHLCRVLIEECGGCFRPQRIPAGVRSNFQNLGVRWVGPEGVGAREIIEHMRAYGVEARSYFVAALHQQPAWRTHFELPITDAILRSLVCLPIHSCMSEQDLNRIAAAARSAARELGGVR